MFKGVCEMTITKQQIKAIEKFAKEHMDELTWWHTQQVRDLAVVLAKKESADAGIVEVAALLHDTGKSKDKNSRFMHHIKGTIIAKNLLNKNNFDFEDAKEILNCIMRHLGPYNEFLKAKLNKSGIPLSSCPRPDTIEAKCVYDADMINYCGPFGIAKTFWLDSLKGAAFRETAKYMKKQSRDAYDGLYTRSGKKMARAYREVSKKFFEIMGV